MRKVAPRLLLLGLVELAHALGALVRGDELAADAEDRLERAKAPVVVLRDETTTMIN